MPPAPHLFHTPTRFTSTGRAASRAPPRSTRLAGRATWPMLRDVAPRGDMYPPAPMRWKTFPSTWSPFPHFAPCPAPIPHYRPTCGKLLRSSRAARYRHTRAAAHLPPYLSLPPRLPAAAFFSSTAHSENCLTHHRRAAAALFHLRRPRALNTSRRCCMQRLRRMPRPGTTSLASSLPATIPSPYLACTIPLKHLLCPPACLTNCAWMGRYHLPAPALQHTLPPATTHTHMPPPAHLAATLTPTTSVTAVHCTPTTLAHYLHCGSRCLLLHFTPLPFSTSFPSPAICLPLCHTACCMGPWTCCWQNFSGHNLPGRATP